MLKNLITIIYASSPHRFGDSICMLRLNHLINQEAGFKDCKFVACLDGPNENSPFSTNKEIERYNAYIQKINLFFEDIEVVKSKKHIGLTMNYMQAWDSKKINTPFVLLLNHDSIFSDEILNVNIKQLLENWLEGLSCIMFPRGSLKGEIPVDWWRPAKIDGSNFFNKKAGKEWADFSIAFGNQDNCCIYKADIFPKIVDEFYKPKETHFLEDSIQEYLQNLDIENVKAWKKFGGMVYNKASSIHLDGISKAGENFIQENSRQGEKVWSAGYVFPEDLVKIKTLAARNPLIEDAAHEFIRETTTFLHEKNKKLMAQVFESASNMCALSLFLEKKPLSSSTIDDFDVTDDVKALPQQKDDIHIHLEISPLSLRVKWEQPTTNNKEKKFLLKACKSNGSKILFGGHPKDFCDFELGEKINKNEVIALSLHDYTSKEGEHPTLFQEELDLNFILFSKDSVLLNSACFSGANPDEIKLYICDKKGKDIFHKKNSNTSFEVLREDLSDNIFFGFFYYYNKEEDILIKSWSFEVQTHFFTENAAQKINQAYEDISCSLGVEKRKSFPTKTVREKFWRDQFSAF